MHSPRGWILNRFLFVTVLLPFVLCACGGGGGSGSTAPPPAGTTAPSGLGYPTLAAYTVGKAITAVSPTVSGTVTGYAVNPALPVGLALDATSGVISGTPTTITAQAKYTVTASNSGGSATDDVLIAVNDVEPGAITYPAPTVAVATGLAIAKLTPSQLPGGGTITGWLISPALPAGLSFSTADGTISGTPTATSGATAYTISASNSGGQQTFVLTLSVQSGPLLELGHADPIAVLRFDGTRVFSLDRNGHWVLWNYATGASIASGDIPQQAAADLAGQTLAIQTSTGFELRSPVDGHITGTIATDAPVWWKLATDGSYLVGGKAGGGLQVWSATGTAVLAKSQGDYGFDAVFAAPGELRAAITFGGSHVIETTPLATGVSTNGPSFTGTFAIWFVDGNRFLTTVTSFSGGQVVSSTVYTYSAAGAQVDTTTIQSLGPLVASGDWFADGGSGGLYVYKVGASGSPTAIYASDNSFTASGSMFVTSNSGAGGAATMSFIDLSGATPVRVDRPLPPGLASGPYAAVSPTQWLSSNDGGALFDGASSVTTPRYLDYGAVTSIAGNERRFAIATASGRVLHYDTATMTLEGTIADFSSQVRLSKDGTVLAAAGMFTTAILGAPPIVGPLTDAQKTHVYSLPGEGLSSTWPANNIDLPPVTIDLSGSGTVLGQAFTGGTAAANPVTGGAATWTATGNCAVVRLSPDGSHIACPAAVDRPFDINLSATQLFDNGNSTAVATVDGLGLGWLDDAHLLAGKYTVGPPKQIGLDSSGDTLYSPAGTVLGTAALPDLHDIQVVTADSIFSPADNTIFAVSSSSSLWMSPDPTRGLGAVAGANVIFASGHQVLALPR